MAGNKARGKKALQIALAIYAPLQGGQPSNKAGNKWLAKMRANLRRQYRAAAKAGKAANWQPFCLAGGR